MIKNNISNDKKLKNSVLKTTNASNTLFEQFGSQLNTIDSSYNIYVASQNPDPDGTDGRIPFASVFNYGPVPILNAVADLTALNDLPKTNLPSICFCWVVSIGQWYQWNGTDWSVLVSLYEENEFTALLDTTEILPFVYTGLNAAYEASLKYLLLINNITESANTTLNAADEVYLKVGQNFTWNQGNFYVDGTAGATQFTIELADPSSVYQYQASEEQLPFVNFDINSSIFIKGNGGNIQNNSTADNTYLYCAGEMIIKDIGIWILPNQSLGGFKTSTYALIDNITFQGSGTNCQKAFDANGGSISNVIFYGNWATSALLNDASAPTNIINLTNEINSPVTFQVNGNLTNVIDNSEYGALILNVASNSSITNANCLSAVLLSGVNNVIFSNIKITSDISFSNDNTNTNISFAGGSTGDAINIYGNDINFINFYFTDIVNIYGTNINFTNCYFAAGGAGQSGSSGNLTNCITAASFTGLGAWGILNSLPVSYFPTSQFQPGANVNVLGNFQASNVNMLYGTWTTQWQGPPAAPVGTISPTYIGTNGFMQLQLPNISTTATHPAVFTCTVNFPSIYAPLDTITDTIQVIDNGVQSTGQISINSSGLITISKANGANFLGVGTTGFLPKAFVWGVYPIGEDSQLRVMNQPKWQPMLKKELNEKAN